MYYKNILPYVIGAITLAPNRVAGNVSDDTYTVENKIENVTDSANIATTDTLQAEFTATPVRVEQAGKSVIYVYSDGRRVVRNNGTRAWRNNNPGNLRHYEFAKNNGAIGAAGNFAVFPDEETGMRALRKLLRTDSYRKLTIAAALKRYDPANWQAYTRRLTRITGMAANTKLGALNDTQLNSVAQTIRRLEGWIAGNEKQIDMPQYAMTQLTQQKVR